MLSDEQIDIFGEGFTDILQKLENDIIADIARRVRKTNRFTETAELQARFLRDMGWSPYKIRIEVFRLLNADKAYIDFVEQNTLEAKELQVQAIAEAREELRKTAPELYAAAGNMSFSADLSMWQEAGKKLKRGGAVDNLIKAMQKRGTDEVLNLTKTLGFKTPTGYTRLHRAYASTLNDALTRTLSGGVSYTAAVEAAVRNLTRSGLRTVDYASGVSREIASAARNAVVTSLGQLTGDIMQTNIEESDVPMVQVSEHWGARESHALWQGKIFTVEQFKAVCGYGEPSNPDHIYSYNCRHSHYPYWPGISEPIAYQREPGPFTINGRQYTYYEATQKQRAMERQIRALKREVNAGGDKATLGSEIRQRTREYKAFSDACGIREKLERLHVLGYDTNRGIKSPNWRSFASGLRKQASRLTDAEINVLRADIEAIGADLSVFSFNTGSRTSYSDKTGKINVRRDVFPDDEGLLARDRMSARAVLAHEYYGHHKFAPSSFPIGDWRDEMRASYVAARNSPGLSREERRDLVVDAYDRAREAGCDYEYSKWAKEIVYGY